MTQLLELTQLINSDGMPKVQIGRSRIEPRLDAKGLSPLELFYQLGLDQNLLRRA